MDRIEPGSFFNGFAGAGKTASHEAKERQKRERVGKGAPFRKQLERSAEAGPHGEVQPTGGDPVTQAEAEELLDAVHSAGDRLKENPTLSEMKHYRELVRRFLRAVVPGAFGVEAHESGTNVLRRKRFALVRVVDRKLERLAVGLLQSQRDELAILQDVDEINGMLVDLVQ